MIDIGIVSLNYRQIGLISHLQKSLNRQLLIKSQNCLEIYLPKVQPFGIVICSIFFCSRHVCVEYKSYQSRVAQEYQRQHQDHQADHCKNATLCENTRFVYVHLYTVSRRLYCISNLRNESFVISTVNVYIFAFVIT